MEFKELVKIRQSDRKYEDRSVEKEKLIQCLETARLSPSANNSQPWKFIMIDDPSIRKQIAEYAASMGMNKFVASAPTIAVVVVEKQNILSSVGSVIQNKPYWLIDVGIAVNQFCLQATDLGLGTCIIGWFNEKKIKKLLNVDRGKRIPLIITIGYADGPTREKKRKSLDEVSSWNKY
jgi:nitroreductase